MRAILKKLGFRRPDPVAVAWYTIAIHIARTEEYFTDLGVPDTVDGRFDMISLTTSLINRRIGLVNARHKDRVQDLAQELFDVMFADLDDNFRALGVSDEGMKHRIKPLASAHLGRIIGYSDALTPTDPQDRLSLMCAALERNVYRAVEDTRGAPRLAARMIALADQLAATDDDDILHARFSFCADAGGDHGT